MLSTVVQFVAGYADPSNSSFSASPNSVVANGTSGIALRVVLKDGHLNVAAGTVVSFTASGGSNTFNLPTATADANGVATSTLTSTLAQSETITASWAGSAGLAVNVTFIAGAASSMKSVFATSPNTQIADNTSAAVAALRLLDINSNPIVGAIPTFSASGSNTTISAASATDSNGQTSASYRSSLAQNENASVAIAGITLTTPLAFVAGAPNAASSSLYANPNVLAGDGVATTSITLTARDVQGNPVAASPVAFSASGGNNTFSAVTGNTDANGQITTTLRANRVQSEVVSAAMNANQQVTTSIIFTGPASVATSTLTINPNIQSVDNSNVLVAVLVLRDSANTPLGNVSSSWSASGTATTVTHTGATTPSGVASATYSSTVAQSQNAIVTSGGITMMAPFSYTAGSPNSKVSTFLTSPSSQSANNTNTIVATLTLQDSFGNALAGQTASFSASGGNTTVAPATSTTSATGTAQATYKSSKAQNENAVVSAGGHIYITPITFYGPPTGCTLTVTPNNQTGDGNNAMSVVATVTDALSSAVPGVVMSYASAGSASKFVPSKTTSNSVGQATALLTSPYAGTNKVFAQNANFSCSAQGNFVLRTVVCAGNPNFVSNTLTLGQSPAMVAIGDLNNDGKQDLAAVNYGSNSASLFFGNGDGTFQTGPTKYLNNSAKGIMFGDFNSDGNQDMAIASTGGGSILVFLATGSGNFAASTEYIA